MKKILLLEADYTQSLPTVKSLHKHGYVIDGVFSHKLSYGYGSRFFNKKFIFEDVSKHENYRDFLMTLLRNGEYSAIIPLSDQSAIVLSKYKDMFSKYTSFVLPSWDNFEHGYDKHKLMQECELGKFPHPKTVAVAGLALPLEKVKSLKFPVLIKPNFSNGARGITYVENIEELVDKFPSVYEEYGECHIQEFIPSGGAQVEFQLYINEKNELVQSSVIHKYRWYPNNGGSSCCNRSSENNQMVETLYYLLKQIGWIGLADFDTIEDPRTGELLIMELNPRLPACTRTAYEAGIDWADVIVSEYLKIPHLDYKKKDKNIILRHLGFEMLWFANSKSKFKSKPCWFKFFGHNVYYQDMNGWNDPLPFLYGTYGNLKKQLSKEFRESKKGMG